MIALAADSQNVSSSTDSLLLCCEPPARDPDANPAIWRLDRGRLQFMVTAPRSIGECLFHQLRVSDGPLSPRFSRADAPRHHILA